MKENTKKNLIKHINILKLFGYKYLKDIDFPKETNKEEIILPNTLENLKDIVDNCNICELSKYTKKKFFSHGNLKSKVMFIGDYPSSDNFDPFAGQSGKMLANMCQNVLKIDPKDVYFTTILKCNLPVLKDIQNEHIISCKDYLIKQINIIQPLVIIVFKTDIYESLKKLNIFDYKNIVLTLSPSFLLRNPSYKKQALEDLQKIKLIIEKEKNIEIND